MTGFISEDLREYMRIIEQLLEIAGKKNFTIDSQVDGIYLFGLCKKYGIMLVRGRLFALGYKKIAKHVFVGRRVKIFEKKNITIGRNSKLHDGVYIDALSREGVHIGENVVLGRESRIECTGSLQYIGKGVTIGDRTTFGSNCMFGAAGGIEIGNDVVAGQFIRFHSENHIYEDCDVLIREQGVSHKGIKIGNNCWIGSGAVFLDGAEIGDGCVVGANAVVTKKYGDNGVLAGIPARILKTRGSMAMDKIE